jgi:hypothetical protein
MQLEWVKALRSAVPLFSALRHSPLIPRCSFD